MVNWLKMHREELIKVQSKINHPDYLILFPMVIYFCLASFKISQPGIYFDEIFFANVARGIIDPGSFIFYKIGNFPVLLMSYVGALKAYFYYPIFLIFGVSAWTIRLPVILLSTLAIFFLYKALSLYFNKPIALGSVVMLAADPSFLSVTRYDLGPNVPEFFLKILCLYYFILFIKLHKSKYLFIIYFLLALGLFNKLHFIWFINSFFLSAMMVYWSKLKSIISVKNPNPKYLFSLLIALAYLSLVSYFLFITFIFNSEKSFLTYANLTEFLERIFYFFSLLKGVINGTYFFNLVFGNLSFQIVHFFWIFFSVILIIGFIMSIIMNFVEKDFIENNYWFFVLLLALNLVQIALTKYALAGWHIFSIYPFTYVLISYYAFLFWKIIPFPFFRRLVPIIIVTFIFSYNVFIYTQYIKSYGHPENPLFSNAIYDLIRYTKGSKNPFISVDWGTHAQLLAFHEGIPGKYIEIVYWLNDLNEKNVSDELLNIYCNNLAKYFNPDNNYFFILHPIDKTVFIKARQNLFDAVLKYNVKLNLFRKITDSRGQVIFEIYNVIK
jgi:hypothetical protein